MIGARLRPDVQQAPGFLGCEHRLEHIQDRHHGLPCEGSELLHEKLPAYGTELIDYHVSVPALESTRYSEWLRVSPCCHRGNDEGPHVSV